MYVKKWKTYKWQILTRQFIVNFELIAGRIFVFAFFHSFLI